MPGPPPPRSFYPPCSQDSFVEHKEHRDLKKKKTQKLLLFTTLKPETSEPTQLLTGSWGTVTLFVLSALVPECSELYLECKLRTSNCTHICSLKILLYQIHIIHIDVYPRASRLLLDLESKSLRCVSYECLHKIRMERWKVWPSSGKPKRAEDNAMMTALTVTVVSVYRGFFLLHKH